jgi:hypothetical protein
VCIADGASSAGGAPASLGSADASGRDPARAPPREPATAAPSLSPRTAAAAARRPSPPQVLGRDQAGVVARVIDAAGAALEGAELSWPDGLDAYGTSDGSGRAVLRFRPPTDALRTAVLFAARGFATRRLEAAVAAGRWTDLGAVALPRAAEIAGRVVDEDGIGVAGACLFVTAADEPRHPEAVRERGPDPWVAYVVPVARSSATGRFRLQGVPAVPVRAWAVAPERRFAYSPVVPLQLGECATETVLACTELPEVDAIEGLVLDPSGEPAAGARLRIRNSPTSELAKPWPEDHAWRREPRWIEADGEGRFRFAARREVLYEVLAEDAAARWEGASHDAVPAGTKELVLRLGRS